MPEVAGRELAAGGDQVRAEAGGVAVDLDDDGLDIETQAGANGLDASVERILKSHRSFSRFVGQNADEDVVRRVANGGGRDPEV